MDIVYRIIEGSYGPENVVFAQRGRAEYVAHIWKALQESKTWGELRRNLPEGEQTQASPERLALTGAIISEKLSDLCATHESGRTSWPSVHSGSSETPCHS